MTQTSFTDSLSMSSISDSSMAELDDFTEAILADCLTSFGSSFSQNSNLYEEQIKGAEHFIDTVTESIRGGKRFRALGAILGATIAKNEALPNKEASISRSAKVLIDKHWQGILCLGSALEFYQAAALVHDDIVDRSSTRRGKPAFHKAMETLHIQNSWLSSCDHFGEASGILAGDLLIACAETTLAQAIAPLYGSSQGLESAAYLLNQQFAKMTGEVAIGQYLELQETHLPLASDPDKSSSSIIEILRLKSARYSVVHPLSLGATYVGADKVMADTIAEIFEPAGIAFQLRDDALGVFGKQGQIGKSISTDLYERKRTALLKLTFQQSPTEIQKELDSIYSSTSSPTETEIERVRSLMKKYGKDSHEQLIDQYRLQSIQALSDSGFSPESQSLCLDFIDLLTVREA